MNCNTTHYRANSSSVPGDPTAKGPNSEWFKVSEATVYFDHPVHAMADHTLNIDLRDDRNDPSQRVALELTATSAIALVGAINAALNEVPEELK